MVDRLLALSSEQLATALRLTHLPMLELSITLSLVPSLRLDTEQRYSNNLLQEDYSHVATYMFTSICVCVNRPLPIERVSPTLKLLIMRTSD